jgi:hypothetical protein
VVLLEVKLLKVVETILASVSNVKRREMELAWAAMITPETSSLIGAWKTSMDEHSAKRELRERSMLLAP